MRIKKLTSLILVAIMSVSLVACGSTEKSETKSQEESITSTKWINVVSGNSLIFNEDGSFEMGENNGTWVQNGKTITFKYIGALSGFEYDMSANIVEENGITAIKSLKCTCDGMQVVGVDETHGAYYPEEIVDSIRAEHVKKIGDTVSTDIMDVTVKKATLCYSAESALTSASDGTTVNINEACEPCEGGYYTSSKGRCLLCIDFEIVNTDRGTADTYDDIICFHVNQNGKSSLVNGYDLNNNDGFYGLDLDGMPISINGREFETNRTCSILIDAGQKVEIKYVGVVGFEPDDLSAPFEIVVEMMNSTGEKEFFVCPIE